VTVPRAYAAACLLVLSATAVAQKSAAPRDDVGVLVLALDSVHSTVTDAIVAGTIGIFRRRPAAVDIRALDRRNLLVALPSELPHSPYFTPAELRDVAEVFRWVVVGIRDSSTGRDSTDVHTTLLVRHPPIGETTLPAIRASTAERAAERIAEMVLHDSVVVRLRHTAGECPTRGLFDFDVDVVAQLLRDSATVAEGRALAAHGADFIQLVVDSVGRPIPHTVKLLNRADSAAARTAKSVVARWRFEPARRGACHVAQVVNLELP
jgi:hypothetical protein